MIIFKEWLFSWGFVILSTVLSALAVFFIKLIFNQFGAIPFNTYNAFVEYFQLFLKSPIAICGILFYLFSPLLWFFALSRLEITMVYPISVSLHLLLTAIIAVLLLGEQITINKIIAMVLILISVFLLYLDS